MKKKECPNEAGHTHHPIDYMSHAEWAQMMLKTHRQEKCPGCGLWKIWVPK